MPLHTNRLLDAVSCLLFTLLVSAKVTGAVAAATMPRSEQVEAVVKPLMEAQGIPGLSVGLIHDDTTRFYNYGASLNEAAPEVTEHTVFEIGSVSKTFTATLATYAAAQGKLSLADHPSRFLPEFAGTALDQATLLHFGTYTAAGLPLQFPVEIGPDDASAVRFIRNWEPTAEPGVRRRYSNSSIGLLGHVTALALNTDFSAAMERQLLPALGLEETYLNLPSAAEARYAWGRNAAGALTRVTPGPFDEEAYGIKTTAADLLRFVALNIDPSVFNRTLREAVKATQVGHFRVGPMVQGLGWEHYPFPVTLEQLLEGNGRAMIMEENAVTQVTEKEPEGSEAVLFNKTGSTNGFGAYVAFVPARRVGVVILANKNYPIPERIRLAYTLLTWLEDNPF